MQAAGCEVWEPAESLAVMGLFEILRDLPRLLRLRARIRRHFLRARPDVFVGIDAPEFNLRLAPRLARRRHPDGAVRQSAGLGLAPEPRATAFIESVDLVLCLLPFEKRFYDNQGVAAEFVGHPLADAIPLDVDRAAARAALGPAGRRRGRSPCCPAAGAARWRALAEDFAATVALARRAASASCGSSRRWRARRPARSSPRCCGASRRRSPVQLIDGQAQTGADRRRRRAGRLRHGEPGGGAVQAAHGRRVPAGRHERLDHTAPESGQIQVFRAAKSTCGSARRRRVFSGTDRPGSRSERSF